MGLDDREKALRVVAYFFIETHAQLMRLPRGGLSDALCYVETEWRPPTQMAPQSLPIPKHFGFGRSRLKVQ
jgi:hypothetical protein